MVLSLGGRLLGGAPFGDPTEPALRRGRGERAPAGGPVVAVFGFKDLGGGKDDAWLSAALSEMVASELAAGESIRVLTGDKVARMKLDFSLKDTTT